MIKSIILTNMSNFEKYELNFSDKTNIIVGPKGGGKSTLFNLLAELEKKRIFSTTQDALENFGLKFDSAELFTGEKISSNNMSILKIKQSDLENSDSEKNPYKERYDVICQDDKIKKDIESFKEVNKNKHKYLKEVLYSSKEVKEFINKFKQLSFTAQRALSFLNDNSINWTNSLNIKITESSNEILYKNIFNSSNELNKCELSINTLDSIIKDYKSFQKNIEKILRNISDAKFSQEFKSTISKENEKIKKELDSLIKLILEEKRILLKTKLIFELFNDAYNKMISNIKAKDSQGDLLNSFKFAAINHFENIAKSVSECKKPFEELVSNEVILNIENFNNPNSILQYVLKDNIKLNQEDIFEILIAILYKPSNSLNEVGKWLNKLNSEGKVKAFEEEKILNKLSNIIQKEDKDLISIRANGKDYSKMSLGEKSMFGIEYKFLKSKKSNLFLDQIEDNLDNHTIATQILDLIKEKKGQKFIVTHNANIGILSNVDKVIVADKSEKGGKVYFPGVIKKVDSSEKDSDLAYYLEGGTQVLENRYKIIKGERNHAN